jgi:hypothetical protein
VDINDSEETELRRGFVVFEGTGGGEFTDECVVVSPVVVTVVEAVTDDSVVAADVDDEDVAVGDGVVGIGGSGLARSLLGTDCVVCVNLLVL